MAKSPAYTDKTYKEKKGCVLVVDDTPTNRVILLKLLSQNGYEVYEAAEGSTAIELAKAHLPTVILLDIIMPGMDGYEVCARLRSEPITATIPIIFLSALDAPFDKVQAFQQGAADYVTKPFQSEEVLARVRHQSNLQLAHRAQQQLNAELESRVKERTYLLELAHSQLLEIALTDRLTRLPNRLAFVKQLSKVMAQAQICPDDHFAVIFLDCDRFKRINDSLGHRVGDQLLKGVARRLSKTQLSHGAIHTIARFGGDEFALLLTQISDRASVVAVADEILNVLGEPFVLAGREIFISASIGLVWGNLDYIAAEHLLRDADVAMYRAKASSRNQYLWFEPAMHNRAVHLLQLETDLRSALENQEFELYYQPIVDLYRLQIVGFEALVRWQHPTRGLIYPNDFIGFAEDTGFIIPLGEKVLKMACKHLAEWERAGLIDADLFVSVNIAAQQLLQPNVLQRVQEIITTAGISTHRLHLELTERSIISNHTFVDQVLRAFQQQNIRLSIDDFGTGYSALSYLHTLPVDCLKVDRSFVHLMTEKSDSLSIVPLIINIAKTMNMQVIAEGIENITQLKQLQQLGCEYGQGYLFQKALPPQQAIALLNRPPNEWIKGWTADSYQTGYTEGWSDDTEWVDAATA
ncbi:MAG: EAL domain-containing protein [Phormidesmis sp. RL_2_1]|nr:EAL domain-containing protein [Phormidesmis sp. RL_2_1]